MEPTDRGSAIDPAKLISIASGKGGVGKTWFSITLAHAMARAGRKVLLFDADLGLANVDIQLGLTPGKDIGVALAGKATLKQCITNYPEGGFDILAGRSGAGTLATLPAPRIMRILQELSALSTNYDKVIVDLGAGLDKTVQLFAGHTGECLVMINDEPTSLTDGYAFIKVVKSAYPELDLRIIVNLAESRSRGEKTYETLLKACKNFLKLEPPLAGTIRRDMRVRESIRAQTPLLTRSPNSEAAVDVEAVADYLFKKQKSGS